MAVGSRQLTEPSLEGPSARRRLGVVLAPAYDLLDGLDQVLDAKGSRLALVFLGLAVGWWIYVPIHELLHVAGCLVAGGTVQQLEIAPEYGGALFAKIFPFVVSGGDYAGRLSGFDDRGSFWIHQVTVLAPYLLTIFPGVWGLRRAAAAARPFWFGIALPVAMAPFISLVGDAYEIGSLVVAEIAPWGDGRLIGDDLPLVARSVANGVDGAGLALGALLGLLWALGTYALGALVARRFS